MATTATLTTPTTTNLTTPTLTTPACRGRLRGRIARAVALLAPGTEMLLRYTVERANDQEGRAKPRAALFHMQLVEQHRLQVFQMERRQPNLALVLVLALEEETLRYPLFPLALRHLRRLALLLLPRRRLLLLRRRRGARRGSLPVLPEALLGAHGQEEWSEVPQVRTMRQVRPLPRPRAEGAGPDDQDAWFR